MKNVDFISISDRSKADSGNFGDKTIRAEEALITLPISYDPAAMLDHLETQFTFSVKAAHARIESQSNNVSLILFTFFDAE